MKKYAAFFLAIIFMTGCAQLSGVAEPAKVEPAKAQQPAIDPVKVQERIAVLDKALPEAQAKVEATKEWGVYKASAEETAKTLDALKKTKEFQTYQQMVNERKYLGAFGKK